MRPIYATLGVWFRGQVLNNLAIGLETKSKFVWTCQTTLPNTAMVDLVNPWILYSAELRLK